MFPVAASHGTSELPPEATFWMPKPEEVDEEGIGCFRDTWLIKDMPVRDAREIIAEEQRIATVIGELADDADEFERFVGMAETGEPDDSDWGLSTTVTFG